MIAWSFLRFIITQNLYRPSFNFPDSPVIFQTIRKLSSHPEIFQPTGNFSDHPATFQTIRKFPNRLEIFRTIWKLFRQSSNFSDHPETFQTIHTLSRPSSNFPDHSETFQCIFKGYAQKLFEYAKTQITMPLCHTGFWASALLSVSSLIVDHPCHSFLTKPDWFLKAIGKSSNYVCFNLVSG